MADLLDIPTYSTLVAQPTVGLSYAPSYLTAVFSAAQQQITRFLRYDPTLSVHSNESGPVSYFGSGAYAGRYLVELVHRPLIPGPATSIFSSLALTYSISLTLPSTVDLGLVTVDHSTARVYCLAPGAIEALMGIGFSRGAALPPVWATGYECSYVSGYSTGIGDPSRPDGSSYNAAPIPADIQYSAALIAQELIAVQTAQNADPGRPFPGWLVGERVGEREQRYAVGPRMSTSALGYGGPLSQQAQAILERYKKQPVAALV